MTNYTTQAHRAYRSNAVETQSPGKLVYLLYEGAIKFLNRSETAIEVGQIEEAHANIIKTQKILYELMNSLDLKIEDISLPLLSLYEYLLNQLIQANIKKDVALIQEVRGHFEELASAWKAIL